MKRYRLYRRIKQRKRRKKRYKERLYTKKFLQDGFGILDDLGFRTPYNVKKYWYKYIKF